MDQIAGKSAIIRYFINMLKKIALFPVYVLSIFTGAKNFRDNYIIGSKVLNILGLHVFRVVLARIVWKLRQAQLSFLINRDDRRFYNQQGYLLKPNFLPQNLFSRVVDEVKNYNGEARECIQGDTITWRVLLDGQALEKFPAMKELTSKDDFLSLLKYASAKNSEPFFYIQQIRNGAINENDPQKILHSDTFHPTMKAWLFLEDVTEEMGPFTYVPESNRLTLARIKWEYKNSIEATNKDKYSAKGSFRIDKGELSELGLSQPKTFAVSKNTLVVANTLGFHARGNVAGEKLTRLEIWAYSRPNPFNPLVGVDSTFLHNISWKIYKKYLQVMDNRAEKIQSRATWQKVQGKVI